MIARRAQGAEQPWQRVLDALVPAVGTASSAVIICLSVSHDTVGGHMGIVVGGALGVVNVAAWQGRERARDTCDSVLARVRNQPAGPHE